MYWNKFLFKNSDLGNLFGMKLSFVEDLDHLYPCYDSPASPIQTQDNFE
jgi:hypothetical protein